MIDKLGALVVLGVLIFVGIVEYIRYREKRKQFGDACEFYFQNEEKEKRND